MHAAHGNDACMQHGPDPADEIDAMIDDGPISSMRCVLYSVLSLDLSCGLLNLQYNRILYILYW